MSRVSGPIRIPLSSSEFISPQEEEYLQSASSRPNSRTSNRCISPGGTGSSILQEAAVTSAVSGHTSVLAETVAQTWKYKLVGDVLIWLSGISLWIASVLLTDDLDSLISNQECRFLIAITWYAILGVTFFSVTLLVYIYRGEPELATRGRTFLIQVTVCIVGVLLFLIISICVLFQKTGLSAYEPTNWYIYTWASMSSGAIICFFSIVSAINLRLRVVYKVYVCDAYNTRYWHGLLVHIPMILISPLSVLICTMVEDVECSTGLYWTSLWVIWALFSAELIFYIVKTRTVPNLFVDIRLQLRLLLLVTSVLVIAVVCGATTKHVVIPLDLFNICIPMCAALYLWELFGLSLIKVVGRQYDKDWFPDHNLAGVAYVDMHDTKNNLISHVLTDSFLRSRLVDMCTARLCLENLMFLDAMNRFNNTQECSSRVSIARNIADKHLNGEQKTYYINVAYETRQVIIDEVEHDYISPELEMALAEAERRVSAMMKANVVELFNQRDVVVYVRKFNALAKVGVVVVDRRASASKISADPLSMTDRANVRSLSSRALSGGNLGSSMRILNTSFLGMGRRISADLRGATERSDSMMSECRTVCVQERERSIHEKSCSTNLKADMAAKTGSAGQELQFMTSDAMGVRDIDDDSKRESKEDWDDGDTDVDMSDAIIAV